MPSVTIIILNYNSGKDILECLESLKDISYSPYRILIVDNASTDDSLTQIHLYVKQHTKEPIEILELSQNYGYAGGNNRGIGYALKKGADYILILNPDTVVESPFLEALMRVAQQYKKEGKEGFFGSRIYQQNEHSSKRNPNIYSNGGLINWSQTQGTLKDYGKSASRLTEVQPFHTQYVTGTCLLISKETIKKVGLMREDYFLYYEDTDWAIRARTQGIAQVIVPASIIWHKVSATTKPGSFSYIYYHTRNGLYCGWDNRRNVAQTIVVLGISKWIFLKQLIKWCIPSRRHWVQPIIKGVYDFWRGKRNVMA